LETGALAIELHSSGSGYGEPIRSAAVLSCIIPAGIASAAKPSAYPHVAARFDAGHISLYGMRKTRLRASVR
jgi:hypothetical protein